MKTALFILLFLALSSGRRQAAEEINLDDPNLTGDQLAEYLNKANEGDVFSFKKGRTFRFEKSFININVPDVLITACDADEKVVFEGPDDNSANGVTFGPKSDKSEVSCIVFTNWGIGLKLEGDVNAAYGNCFGTNSNCSASDLANDVGISVSGTGAKIGHASKIEYANVISNSNKAGIHFEKLGTDSPRSNSQIRGNMIGTNLAGKGVLGGPQTGILIDHLVQGILISFNIISGNGGDGIYIHSAGDIEIYNNGIGVDASLDHALPNAGSGISAHNAHNVTIGGISPAQKTRRNTISGNLGYGILLKDNTHKTVISSNNIGVNGEDFGPKGIPNGRGQIFVENSQKNIIGGDLTSFDYNLIAGGDNQAIITLENANYNEITGNYIGYGHYYNWGNKGNGQIGIRSSHSSHVKIDGNTIGSLNQGIEITYGGPIEIKDNRLGGEEWGFNSSAIYIEFASEFEITKNKIGYAGSNGIHMDFAYEGIIQDNQIGFCNTGIKLNTHNLLINDNEIHYNYVNGIHLHGLSNTNNISDNIIRKNGKSGVQIDTGCLDNTITRNSIYANADLGIDLGSGQIIPTTVFDSEGDTVAPPTIENIKIENEIVYIDYSFAGSPGRSYIIEFFAGDIGKVKSNNVLPVQGRYYLGATDDIPGSASFTGTFECSVRDLKGYPDGITATATTQNGATSQFAAGSELPPIPTYATSEQPTELTFASFSEQPQETSQEISPEIQATSEEISPEIQGTSEENSPVEPTEPELDTVENPAVTDGFRKQEVKPLHKVVPQGAFAKLVEVKQPENSLENSPVNDNRIVQVIPVEDDGRLMAALCDSYKKLVFRTDANSNIICSKYIQRMNEQEAQLSKNNQRNVVLPGFLVLSGLAFVAVFVFAITRRTRRNDYVQI